jgi:hypothetical protein
VHVVSRGMLGDAMKQILSLGYVLLHTNDDGTAFTDEQGTYPLIIRYNKEEWLVSVEVNKAAQTAPTDIKLNKQVFLKYTDTEIELWLPVIDEVRNDLTRDYIEEFCRKYTLFNTGVSFKFTIIDFIHHGPVISNKNKRRIC